MTQPPTLANDDSPDAPSAPKPSPFSLQRLSMTFLKIAIAVVGIFLVARMISWNDTAILPAGTSINNITFPEDVTVTVLNPDVALNLAIPPRPAANASAPATEPHVVLIQFPDSPVKVSYTDARGPHEGSLVVDTDARLPGADTIGISHQKEVPFSYLEEVKGERIKGGLRGPLLLASSRWYYLLAAWALMVIPYFVTAIRWRNLLIPQGIHLRLKTALELTFVGQFYSILLPGITGGDLVKIVYAARLTGSKSKSFITIVLDRVIGLVALMTIAGVAAAGQLLSDHFQGQPVNPTMLRVLIFIAAGLAALGLGSLVYFSHRLRKATGLAALIQHRRMPDFVRHLDETLHAYRHHFGLLTWAFLISLASQFTLPLAAFVAGNAFGMHLALPVYLAYIPVAVLASSLPISPPQGFGVLDGLIIWFLAHRAGATPSQAFAVAQAVRFLPVLWNLVGAYWVIRGDYSRKAPPRPDSPPLATPPSAAT